MACRLEASTPLTTPHGKTDVIASLCKCSMLCLCLEGEEHAKGEVQSMRLAPERASVGLLWPRRQLWKVSCVFYGRQLGLEIILGNPVWYQLTNDNTGFLPHLISRASVSNCQRSSVQALCLEMRRHILGRRCLEQPASVDDPKPHHPIFSRYFLDKRFADHFFIWVSRLSRRWWSEAWGNPDPQKARCEYRTKAQSLLQGYIYIDKSLAVFHSHTYKWPNLEVNWDVSVFFKNPQHSDSFFKLVLNLQDLKKWNIF